VTRCDCSARSMAAAVPAAHPPSCPVGSRPAKPDAATDTLSAPSAEPDCVGPITIPRELTQALRALSAAAAVDDFVPFCVCAAELVRRWSRGRRPMCAQVIREPREAVVSPAAGLADHGVSFLTALCRAHYPATPTGAARPVDVAILVSQDGDRLYVERMTNAADSPGPGTWARSFLQLLTALADMPFAPVRARPLAEAAEALPARTPGVAPSMVAVP
jgi:hypothetical protein